MKSTKQPLPPSSGARRPDAFTVRDWERSVIERELADCMTYERASTGVDRRDRFERPRDCVPTLEELK